MLRIEKKERQSRMLLQRLLSVALALVCSGAFIAACGYDPIQVYGNMVTGAFSSAYYRSQTVEKMIPLVIMGLGVAVCFKMKLINIGAEGQFCMGAVGATWIALFSGEYPAPVKWVLMFIAAFAFGGLWCLIAGLLKAKWRVSATLVTLLLNYVAIKIVSYLQYKVWKDPKAYGYPKIRNYPNELQLPEIFGVHAGFIVAIVLIVAVYFLLKKTKLGYEISVTGDTEATARYAGINTRKLLVLVSMIGGGICGIAGMVQASGAEHTLNDSMSGGLGFTAIVVTYLAGMEPLGIVLVAFLFAILLQGSAYMQIAMQIPASSAEVIQGIILLFVLGSEFFSTYRVVRTGKKKKGGGAA